MYHVSTCDNHLCRVTGFVLPHPDSSTDICDYKLLKATAQFLNMFYVIPSPSPPSRFSLSIHLSISFDRVFSRFCVTHVSAREYVKSHVVENNEKQTMHKDTSLPRLPGEINLEKCESASDEGETETERPPHCIPRGR